MDILLLRIATCVEARPESDSILRLQLMVVLFVVYSIQTAQGFSRLISYISRHPASSIQHNQANCYTLYESIKIFFF